MTPKEECEELLNKMLPFAEEMLNKYGEFYPYGSVMNSDGSVRSIAEYDGNENPPSQQVIDNLSKIYHELATKKEIRASCIVWDGRVATENIKKSDAVIMSLEHKENYSVIMVFPYRIENKKAVWIEPFAMKGENRVF